MGNGFRWGNLYGSWWASNKFNGIGFEMGIIDIPTMDKSMAHTFSIAVKLSYFIFAIGYIFKEY